MINTIVLISCYFFLSLSGMKKMSSRAEELNVAMLEGFRAATYLEMDKMLISVHSTAQMTSKKHLRNYWRRSFLRTERGSLLVVQLPSLLERSVEELLYLIIYSCWSLTVYVMLRPDSFTTANFTTFLFTRICAS